MGREKEKKWDKDMKGKRGIEEEKEKDRYKENGLRKIELAE